MFGGEGGEGGGSNKFKFLMLSKLLVLVLSSIILSNVLIVHLHNNIIEMLKVDLVLTRRLI